MAKSVAVETVEKPSDGTLTEKGVVGGRGSAEFTAFELKEKFKHVSCFMSSLTLSMLCLPPVCHHYPSLCHCYLLCFIVTGITLVAIGYSVVILLTSDWLKNIFEDEHVNLLMLSFNLR